MAKWKSIIIADASGARIFRASGGRLPWEQVAVLNHPPARARNRDLLADRPGRSFDSVGGGRHAMVERTDPHQHEAEVFAQEIAHHLKHSEALKNCSQIALVAPPKFLGLLRKHLDQRFRERVACEVDKNLVAVSWEEIRKYLPPGW